MGTVDVCVSVGTVSISRWWSQNANDNEASKLRPHWVNSYEHHVLHPLATGAVRHRVRSGGCRQNRKSLQSRRSLEGCKLHGGRRREDQVG